MILLSIDPGYATSGFAEFNVESGRLNRTWQFTAKGDFPERLKDIVDHLIGTAIYRVKPTQYVIEQPEWWIAEGRQIGAMKLIYATSAIYTVLVRHIPIERVYMIPVNTWKGRGKKAKKKSLTKTLVELEHPHMKIATHARDAVHLGMWCLPFIKAGKMDEVLKDV